MPGPFELSPEDLAQASAQSHQQVSPQTSGLDELQPLPWWKRRLLATQTAQPGAPMPDQSQGGGSVVDNWASLGAGVGNLARKLIGMERGGAVQGPTLALIGEGGEPEYVLPESKVAPWIERTVREGVPPNPADVPRSGYMPPPPVILPPQGGGSLPPRMANGGMVYPRPVPPPMMDPAQDYFGVGEEMPAYSEAPQFAPPPISIPRPQRPLPQMPTQAWDARKAREAHLAQGPPQAKWYERLVGRPQGDVQLDMRPGVAGYSQAGRALRGVLSNVLPYGRKMEEFQRKDAALKAAEATEMAQNAAADKQYQRETERVKAEDALETAASTRARNDRQGVAAEAAAAKSGQRELKSSDFTNQETGDVTRVWSDPITGKEVRRETIPGVAKPKPTAPPRPQQPTAASLAQIASDPSKTPEERNAAKESLRLLKPPKQGGGGSGTDGNTALVDAVMANPAIFDSLTPTARTSISADLQKRGFEGFGKPMTDTSIGKVAEMKSAIESVKELQDALRENEQYVGPIAGLQTLNPWSDARKVQAKIDLVKQRVGKALEGGVLRKEDEEKYKKILATLNDEPSTAISKIDGLIQTLERDISIFEAEQKRGGRRVGASDAPKDDKPQAPIVQRSKKTGAFRHSLDGGKTWLNGQPK